MTSSKQFWTIFKLLFKYMFKPGGEKASRWYWLAYAIVGLSMAIMVAGACLSIYSIAPVFMALEIFPNFMAIILGVAGVAVSLFGLIPMLNYLYFSKDTEFFFALPIKPALIFTAKLSIIYMTEMILTVLFVVPCIITAGIAVNMSFLYYIIMMVAIILVPAIPMVFVSLIAIPLMYIVSFFKNKGALTSIVIILLFGVIFGLYYMLILNMNSSLLNDADIDLNEMLQQYAQAIKSISYLLLPMYSIAEVAALSTKTIFGDFSQPIAITVNSAMFIGFICLSLFLTVIISGAVYRRGAVGAMEGSGSKINSKIEFSAKQSAVTALFKKEWLELVRTPAFAFQSLAGIIMAPIVLLFMYFSFNTGIQQGVSETGEISADAIALVNKIMFFVLVGFISAFGVGTNVGASTAITREGDRFYYGKLIPVSYSEQISAKLKLYVIISSVAVMTSLIVLAFISFDIINLICSAAFLLIFNYAYNCFCIYFDLNKPKLNWVTPNEAVKNNKNTIIPMLLNWAVTFVIVIIPIVLTLVVSIGWLASLLSWVILIGISIVLAIVFHSLLFANAERLYNKINV